MIFNRNISHRRFEYKPFFHKPDDEGGINFRRITRYDPHQNRKALWVYMLAVLLITAWLIMSGGIGSVVRLPQLTVEDVAGR